ncbi:MAG: ribosome maturation factor RimP [Bacilli bacterium]|nr:ribosome maturation factor RimP [Bacilli bacterium]
MEIVDKALILARRCAEKLQLDIVEVEYVSEKGLKILRVIAEDKTGLTIDQATDLNNLISDELDKEDFIDEEYYLEVSSPGIERELKKEEDIIKSCDQYICVNTYEKVEGLKELYGYLRKYEDQKIFIDINIKGKNKILEIPKSKISKIRLAVKF